MKPMMYHDETNDVALRLYHWSHTHVFESHYFDPVKGVAYNVVIIDKLWLCIQLLLNKCLSSLSYSTIRAGGALLIVL